MTAGTSILTRLSPRIWTGDASRHTYALLDAASTPGLLDQLHGPDAPPAKCLLTGDLAPDMVHVAPYLAELAQGSTFAQWAIDGGWGKHWGIFALSRCELPQLWRALRTLTRVFDPDGKPMFFRYYDPRVMRRFVPTLNPDQLQSLFSVVDCYVVEGETPDHGLILSFRDGALQIERFAI